MAAEVAAEVAAVVRAVQEEPEVRVAAAATEEAAAVRRPLLTEIVLKSDQVAAVRAVVREFVFADLRYLLFSFRIDCKNCLPLLDFRNLDNTSR